LEPIIIEQMETGDLRDSTMKNVRSRDFYAVFATPPEWDVFYKERTLGRISPRPDLHPGTCLLLVGRLWEVKEIFENKQQVMVEPAKGTHDVIVSRIWYSGDASRLAQRAREILRSEKPFSHWMQLGNRH
jgi:ATP-dependent Lhr-like helicase